MKQTWKTAVRRAVYQHQAALRKSRVICDSDFFRFSAIINDKDPSNFWHFSSNCSEISQCKFICKLISDQPYENSNICQLCGVFFFCDFFTHTHITCSCAATYLIRYNWWTVISYFLYICPCSELHGLLDEELFFTLLGRKQSVSWTRMTHGPFNSLILS